MYPAVGLTELLDIEVFTSVEEDMYAAFKFCGIVELALWFFAKYVGRCRVDHLAPLDEFDCIAFLRE